VEKASKADEERLAKGEQRKSRTGPALGTAVVATSATDSPTASGVDGNADLYEDPTVSTGVSDATVPVKDTAASATARDSTATVPSSNDPTSPTSPSSSKGFKSMFNKLKRRSKHESTASTDSNDKDSTGFIGGATLRASEPKYSATAPSASHAEASSAARPHDLGDVEPDEATKPTVVPHVDEPVVVPHVKDDRYSDISSLSSDDEELPRGRPRVERLMSDDTRASSDFEEARDHFDEGLAPPPTFTTDVQKGRVSSPARDSKFHEVGI
jgi:hypothetical protein